MWFENKRLLNFMTLFSGTTASQVANFFLYVILSRLFPEESFGLFSLFTSYVVLTSVISNPQIPLLSLSAKSDDEINEIESISEGLLVYSLIGIIFFYACFYFIGNGRLQAYLLLIPIAVFFYTLTENRKVFASQREKFREANLLTIIPRTSGNLVKIALSFLSKGALGLILGEVIGNLYSLKIRKIQLRFSFIEVISKLKQRKQFLLYNYPSVLVVVALTELMPLFMVSLYSLEIAGAYFLFEKFILQPFTLVGASVGNSQSRYIGSLNRQSRIRFFGKLTVLSFLATIPIIAIMGITGEKVLLLLTNKVLFHNDVLLVLSLHIPLRFFRGIIHVFHHATLGWHWGAWARGIQFTGLMIAFAVCKKLDLEISWFFIILWFSDFLGEMILIFKSLRKV
jgi:O-antigen/teichoic acid export membrane protein